MLPTGGSVFDLRCLYDEYRKRFFIVGLANGSEEGHGRLLIAVSQSENPADGRYRYWHPQPSGPDAPAGGMDYPSIGIGADTLYVTYGVSGRSVLVVDPADLMAQRYVSTTLVHSSFEFSEV